jgi:hypothetical protein
MLTPTPLGNNISVISAAKATAAEECDSGQYFGCPGVSKEFFDYDHSSVGET